MIQNKKISLIIPCRNEEAALFSMLKKVPDFIDEIIVVDNGSTDNTKMVAKRFKANVLNEKREQNGVGYGYAYQKGLSKAKGDIIVCMDGDDTYPLRSIKQTIQYMEKSGSDFVSCARFPLVNHKAISSIRQVGVWILNMWVGILYGYHMKDILSGMWVIKRDTVRSLNLISGDWNFSPEIKLSALAHPSIHFSEYHISHAVRLNGLSKQQIWKTGFEHMLYILYRRLWIDKHYTKIHSQIVFEKLRFSFKMFLFFITLHVFMKRI